MSGLSRMPGGSSPISPSPSVFATPSCRRPGRPRDSKLLRRSIPIPGFIKRESAAQQGQIYEADLHFAPAGHFYKKPGFWPKSKNNFAPRFAIAYSPDTKTSIRVGAGIYYDHYGQALVNIFDQNGSFGMSSSCQTPRASTGSKAAPSIPPRSRFIDRQTLSCHRHWSGACARPITFPYLCPQNNFAITWGLDSKLKTPYAEAFDLSVQT